MEQNKSIDQIINKWYAAILVGLVFVLYGNTLTHDYAVDDAIVITDNMYTKSGVQGIPGILSKDTFFGFFKVEGKANLVSGGRYRPMSLVFFALEYELFGLNPFWGHLFNVLFYALLCILVFKLLQRLLTQYYAAWASPLIVMMITLLFAAHPLHTEVVANIKGRDEIFAMIGSVGAILLLLKAMEEGKVIYYLLGGMTFLFGLLSKENTITYLAVFPLILFAFKNVKLSSTIRASLPLVLATVVFLVIRYQVLGFDFGGTPMELMNNPYLKIDGNQYVEFTAIEKYSTILFTLLLYLKLLLIPHPLTHDYYPRHIEVMTLGDWQVWLSIAAHLLLLIWAYRSWKEHKVISFSVLYYYVTLSIVSNIVFPIGTNMSERFLFMPSLGFCILLIYLLKRFVKGNVWVYIVGFFLLGYTAKTITRNTIWKDDFTLFTTDVKTSRRSAKVLNAAGGALTNRAMNETNMSKKTKMLNKAIAYLNEAQQVHPNYKNAALIKGNAYYYLDQFENAIESYSRALTIAPDYKEASDNLAISLRSQARIEGEKNGNLSKAQELLKRSISLVDTDPEAYRLLGITMGMQGRHELAVQNFLKVVELVPDQAGGYVNLANAYKYLNDEENVRKYTEKALQLDPNALKQ